MKVLALPRAALRRAGCCSLTRMPRRRAGRKTRSSVSHDRDWPFAWSRSAWHTAAFHSFHAPFSSSSTTESCLESFAMASSSGSRCSAMLRACNSSVVKRLCVRVLQENFLVDIVLNLCPRQYWLERTKDIIYLIRGAVLGISNSASHG